MDGIQNVQAHNKRPISSTAYPDEIAIGDDVEAKGEKPVFLDHRDETKSILHHLQEWWNQAREAQSANRAEMFIDGGFYDGDQWDEEDEAALVARGQAPYVFNVTKPAADWVIGTEKRTKLDHKVYSRTDDPAAREDAEVKTKVLKYLDDVNQGAAARSAAFKDAIKVGVGWIEDGVRNDAGGEPIFSRHEHWANIWYDHLSIDPALKDARYLFRSKWIDLDYSIAMFPEQQNVLQTMAEHQDALLGDSTSDEWWYSDMFGGQRTNRSENGLSWTFTQDGINQRKRVRLVECWYRVPVRIKKMRGFQPELDNVRFDPTNEEHKKAVGDEIVSLHDAVDSDMWVAIFGGNHLLQNMRSPYTHNEFPFTPCWAYRKMTDSAPYGMIRQIRDPQDDLNKRMSKAQFILSTNQVLAEEGAVEPEKWDEMVEQAAHPAGVVPLKNGALQHGRFQIHRDNQLAEEHVKLMDRDQAMVRNVSGVQGENLGADTSAVSGKAILAKQNEGSVVTFELYDNLQFMMSIQGMKRISLVEQFMDMPKVIRLTGSRGKVDYVHINEPEWDTLQQKWVFRNDMTRFHADFVIDQADFRATVRQAMFDTLMDMLSKLDSQIALQLLDIVVDMNDDLPEREELVSRIRKVNGQTDPNQEETPEQAAEKAEQAQKAKEQEKLQIRQIVADILNKEANAAKIRVDTQKTAIDAGLVLAQTPVIAGSADEFLNAAGFVDATQPISGQPGPGGGALMPPQKIPAQPQPLPEQMFLGPEAPLDPDHIQAGPVTGPQQPPAMAQ